MVLPPLRSTEPHPTRVCSQAWLLDAERAAEEEREAAMMPIASMPALTAGLPSLDEVTTCTGKLKKKNKGTTLSLLEFAGYGPVRDTRQ
uniref:Uncharacterized protein n=1 Tax=Arundo donax TaxID=35708 RepID=A0A0A9G761_ARUDO